MKIYASYTDENILKEYAGKDIWIRCLDNKFNETVYVRVLFPVTSSIYHVNIINEDDLHAINKSEDHEAAMNEITGSYTRGVYSFEVLDPLVTLTTKEIYPKYNPNYAQFDRFVSKDIWVKVTQYPGYLYYIKILRKNGAFITCSHVPAERVDMDTANGIWYVSQETIDYVLNNLDNEHTDNIDNYVLSEPLEVLTTEELIEMIKLHLDPAEE